MSKRNRSKKPRKGNFKDHGGGRNKPAPDKELSPQEFFGALSRELHIKFNGPVPADQTEYGFIMLVFPIKKTGDAVTVSNIRSQDIGPILKYHGEKKIDAESPLILPPGAK